MLNITNSGREKLQKLEEILSSRRYKSVWQHIEKKILFDSISSYWIDMFSGQGILITLNSIDEGQDSINVYELNPIDIENRINKICTICKDLGTHSTKEHQVNLDINPPTSIERENESLRKDFNSLMELIKDEPEGLFQSEEFHNTSSIFRLTKYIERIQSERKGE